MRWNLRGDPDLRIRILVAQAFSNTPHDWGSRLHLLINHQFENLVRKQRDGVALHSWRMHLEIENEFICFDKVAGSELDVLLFMTSIRCSQCEGLQR